ncbi:MAG: transposase [bacterium]|nr:transposase [bacterium]
MRKRSQFANEFKLEAVRLLDEGNKPAADLARELRVRQNQLYKWKDTFDKNGNNAFPGTGRQAGTGTEIQAAEQKSAYVCG